MLVYIGFDPRETDGYEATVKSIKRFSPDSHVRAIHLPACRTVGMYTRPLSRVDGKLWDDISNAPMSTEFAITRFLVPHLARLQQCSDDWAVFMDCDMLLRCDIDEMMEYADPDKAVVVVKHDIEHGTGVKMDDCQQTSYPRKNWSSVILWNLKHPANSRLTLDAVNGWKGKDLHQFKWLEDDEIGEMPCEWNHLVGLMPENPHARIVHYTLGIPSMPGYGDCEYSQEWYDEFAKN